MAQFGRQRRNARRDPNPYYKNIRLAYFKNTGPEICREQGQGQKNMGRPPPKKLIACTGVWTIWLRPPPKKYGEATAKKTTCGPECNEILYACKDTRLLANPLRPKFLKYTAKIENLFPWVFWPLAKAKANKTSFPHIIKILAEAGLTIL